MGFLTLLNKLVGDPLKKDDWDKVKDNFDDHESRIASNESQAAKIIVYDSDVKLGASAASVTGLIHYKAIQAFTVTTVEIQIFSKGPIVSGILEIDVKKNTTPDDIGMTSIMTTLPSVDFSTASDYDTSSGILSVAEQDIAVDGFLRFDITSLPVGLGSFRILVYGEV